MDIKEIISKLTIEEKCMILQGKTSWETYDFKKYGIPSMYFSDGPHGLRKQLDNIEHSGKNGSYPATCFPTAATIANSWDVDMLEDMGIALGLEAKESKVNVLLGPGLNIKRSPLCGRNFEYFSEDPYLSGKMAASLIKGIEKEGISACPKHFACNNQETYRMSYNAILDERTLREMYLTAFEIAIKEGHARSIMSSYNRMNGTYSNENSFLLKDILRNEWGFKGIVMSDWGADNDRLMSAKSGSNIVMPNPGINDARDLCDAIKRGEVDIKEIDDRLYEILSLAFDTDKVIKDSDIEVDYNKHYNLAIKCAENSIVLLENDGTLPLDKDIPTALIGDFMVHPRYQGAGSSLVNPIIMDNLKDSLEKLGLNIVGFERGYSYNGEMKDSASLISKALELAKKSEVVILSIGLNEVTEFEGKDRESLQLSKDQIELLNEVSKVAKKLVLVLSGGAPFVIPEVKRNAVINGYLGGEASGMAMARVLLGLCNPSGKLAESWPLKIEDTPCYSYYLKDRLNAYYKEGLYVGYRYYDTKGIKVQYPFGYGLSYTKFEYKNIECEDNIVSFDIENVGLVTGYEIAEVYISKPISNCYRPKKELKGFKKVLVPVNEKVHVEVTLDDKAFRTFYDDKKKWVIEEGAYEILVGSSSNDIRLKCEINLEGEKIGRNVDIQSYFNCDIHNIKDVEFKRQLGYEIPKEIETDSISFNDPLCKGKNSKSFILRTLVKHIERKMERSNKKGIPDMMSYSIYYLPFRTIGKFSGGLMDKQMVYDLVKFINKDKDSGCIKLIKSYRRNKRLNKEFLKRVE